MAGDYTSKDVVGLVTELFEFVRDFKGEVPGAAAKDCGNYLDMNLPMANYLGKRYLEQVLYNIKEDRLVYPEEDKKGKRKWQKLVLSAPWSWKLMR